MDDALSLRPSPRWPSLGGWFRAEPRNPERSVELLRIVTALLLLAHPLHALLHPEEMRTLGAALAICHLPAAAALAWGAALLQLACALALLAKRAVLPACLGSLLVVGAGAVLLYAPYWYVVGGATVDGHPGVEFNLLLMACLAGLLRGRRAGAARQGLDIVRISAALILATHPVHGVFDPAGLREFGKEMSGHGFPFGLFLVWAAMFTQILSSLALLLRRCVVPAVLGQFLILVPGVWIAHWPDWFVVWPKYDGGMEYSLLLIACFFAVGLAHWPARERTAAAA